MTESGDTVLMFERAGARHAVAAAALRGVAPRPEATMVPGAPRSLRGLIAWRGGVIPMLEPGTPSDADALAALVIESDGGELALAADDVIGFSPREAKMHLLDPDTVYHRVRDAVRRSNRAE